MKGHLLVTNGTYKRKFDIDELRDIWFRTSYLLDRRQSGAELAKERYDNYIKHELNMKTGRFQRNIQIAGHFS